MIFRHQNTCPAFRFRRLHRCTGSFFAFQARSIEAGMVFVNTQNVRDLRQPFGGVKASGTGREGGEYSFEVFAEMKNVCISMGDHPIPKWGI